MTNPAETSSNPEVVWQDNWPSVAYAIDYDHEKNSQINPAVMRELLIDVGVPDEKVPELTVVMNNKKVPGPPGAKGIFLNHSAKEIEIPKLTGPNFQGNYVIGLTQPNGDRLRTRIAIHESKHFSDELAGQMNSMKENITKISIGAGIGAVACGSKLVIDAHETLTNHDIPIIASASVYTGAFVFGALFGAYGGAFTTSWFRASERRARKAERNKEMLKKYTENLFTNPEQ